MRTGWNKKTIGLAAAACILVAGATAGSAMAYFTTYAEAEGSQTLSLGMTTTIPDEEVSNWTKHIRVQNTGDYSCYVRVKVFAGSQLEGRLSFSDESGKWTPGADEYYYYSDIVAPGASSDEMKIKIDSTGLDQDFNIIVVQECTPVLYDENGNPYADWNAVADSTESSYTEADGEVAE